jgi:hypothetical protein
MRSIAWLAALGLALGAAATPVSYAEDKAVERFTAFAVDLSGSARTSTATVDIAIERWSTEQEWNNALAALRENGTEGLLKDLQKVEPRIGYIRTATSIGFPLRLAHQSALPGGGRRILIATDRRMSFLEVSRNLRTTDYPFMIVELRMGPDGEGQGKLMPVAKVTQYPDDVVEIENYAAQPVRLTKVKRVS